MIFIRRLFLAVEGMLYFTFTYISLYETKISGYENILKYISIILCFLFAVISQYSNSISFRESKEWTERKKDGMIIILGLGGTLAADWCILLNNYHTLGVSIFILVQIGYLYRLSRFIKIHHYSKGILFIGSLVALRMAGVRLDFLLVLSMCYEILILENGFRGLYYLLTPKGSNGRIQEKLFSLGLFLFLLCDINVAVFNMNRYLSLNSPAFQMLYHFASVGMWLFYLPSQVLISYSVLHHKV